MKQRRTKSFGLGLVALLSLSVVSGHSQSNPPSAPPTAAPAALVPAPAAPGISANLSTQPPTQRSRVVEQQPPPPRPEVVPLAPGTNYVWIPGYWGRRDGNWNWHGGLWVLRPAPGFYWVDGHWAKHGRGWIWMNGHWR